MKPSLEKLYVENRPWLFNWLHQRMGNAETAADIVHDTYEKLLLRKKYPTAEQSEPYLRQIAKGLMIDHYRRQNIEQAYLALLKQQPESNVASPETHHLAIEALIEIDALLSTLPEKTRTALLLRQLEGLSYKRIAEKLSVSISSVEKYVARGLATCYFALESES